MVLTALVAGALMAVVGRSIGWGLAELAERRGQLQCFHKGHCRISSDFADHSPDYKGFH